MTYSSTVSTAMCPFLCKYEPFFQIKELSENWYSRTWSNSWHATYHNNTPYCHIKKSQTLYISIFLVLYFHLHDCYSDVCELQNKQTESEHRKMWRDWLSYGFTSNSTLMQITSETFFPANYLAWRERIYLPSKQQHRHQVLQ